MFFIRRGTKYNPKEWERIINSKFLENFIDAQIKRHFSRVNLPETNIIFNTIKEFIANLNL